MQNQEPKDRRNCLCSKQAVVDNRKEIDRRVLGKIETDFQFKKYGVPINALRLSEIVLRNDYALEYIFELKE